MSDEIREPGDPQPTDAASPPHRRASDAHEPIALDDRPLEGLAPEAPDEGWWSDIDRRHKGLIIAGVSVVVALLAIGVGVGVAMIGSRMNSPETAPAPITGSIPETETAQPEAEPVSVPDTSTPATAAPAPVPAIGRARLLAYRQDGAVWVVGESGEDPRRVFNSSAGPFALSPDGASIAIIDTASETLSIVDVASGRSVVVGKAVPDRPSWAADSSVFVYSSQKVGTHDTEVDRVKRDGTGRVSLGLGFGGRFMPDGRIAAISAKRSQAGTPIEVLADGAAARLLGTTISPNALAPLTGSVVFADAGGLVVQGTPRPPSLEVIGYDGTGLRELVARPTVAEGVFFGDVFASPDLTRVAYTEAGDDGYSRMFCIRATGGAPVSLSTRRDAYILGWTADGSEIVYIDGNQMQEEPTRLMAIRPDGTGRRTIIDGATY
ncbi:MAG: hypothetical protein Q7W30_10245 [Coriobacteriia bacterium]|nr:hypothetical protein [Coriobacteriia bacterium]